VVELPGPERGLSPGLERGASAGRRDSSDEKLDEKNDRICKFNEVKVEHPDLFKTGYPMQGFGRSGRHGALPRRACQLQMLR
jgi:hypothetical protein